MKVTLESSTTERTYDPTFAAHSDYQCAEHFHRMLTPSAPVTGGCSYRVWQCPFVTSDYHKTLS